MSIVDIIIAFLGVDLYIIHWEITQYRGCLHFGVPLYYKAYIEEQGWASILGIYRATNLCFSEVD